MPANISLVANTSTFRFLVDRVNELITVANTTALTINSTANGNTAITGTFTANTVVANTANVTNFTTFGIVSNTTNLTITGNTINTTVANTTSLNINQSVTSGLFANTTGTSIQVIDSFLLSAFGSAEYILDVKDNVANNQSHSRISILNSGTVFSTEYAQLTSNNVIGQFTVTSNTTHCLVNYQPTTSTNTSIKGFRTLITR
jgi:hypothetical protein